MASRSQCAIHQQSGRVRDALQGAQYARECRDLELATHRFGKADRHRKARFIVGKPDCAIMQENDGRD